MNDKLSWKDMAGNSAMQAAVRATYLFELLSASKAMLEVIPDHWHDEATTNLRDTVAEIEKAYPKSGNPA